MLTKPRSNTITAREKVVEELESLNDDQLKQLADYVMFLKIKNKFSSFYILKEQEIAKLYGQASDEDKNIAEEGMSFYSRELQKEDNE